MIQLLDEHILTPETEKHFFTDQILPPLLQGESLSIVKVPHSGVKFEMQFLINYASSLGFHKLGKYRFFYLGVNELIENNPEGFFQLFNQVLGNSGGFKKETVSVFFEIKRKIKEYIEKNVHVIIIIGEFNRLNYPLTFFNNLQSLWQIGRDKIHFLFVVTQNIFGETSLPKFGELAELITQNIIYFPLLSTSDSLFVVERLNKKYHYHVSENKKKEIIKLAGGHPMLIRACLRALSKLPTATENELKDYLSQRFETKIILEDIWKSLSQKEKIFLSTLITIPKVFPENLDFLLKMRLIYQEKGQNKLFSPLFETYLKSQKINESVLSLDKSGDILLNNQPVEEKITLYEYRLLTQFLQNPQKVITRDQISEILWGKDSFQKYSDWAIDQRICFLRKKLKILGISPNRLQTIKGRGYRWQA